MKKMMLGVLMFFSIHGMAIEAYTPKDNYPELEKIDNPVALGQLPVLSLDKSLMKTYHLTLLYTYAQSSFEQTGEGQVYETEAGRGNGLFATYNYKLHSGNELDLKLWNNQTHFTEPNDIGGENVAVAKNYIAGLYSWVWHHTYWSWNIDFGASHFSQNSGDFTTGGKLVPNYLALGPTVAMGVKYQLGTNWKVKTNLATSLPLYFQEYGANSGYHRLSLHYLGILLFERKIRNNLFFNIGLMAEGEEHRFKGVGEREVEDAIVSTFTYAIPIGVSYAF